MREIVAFGFFVYYLVKTLLFEERISHFGPFVDKNIIVRSTSREVVDGKVNFSFHDQPASIFDKIRQSITKCYKVEIASDGKSYWFVDEERIEVWTCPKCLSFWMSAPIFFYVLIKDRDLLKAILCAVSAAGISTFLNSVLDE